MLAYYAGIICQHIPLLRGWVATCGQRQRISKNKNHTALPWPCSSQCGAGSPTGNLDTKGLIWPNQCSECPQFSQKGRPQWSWYERNQMSFIFLIPSQPLLHDLDVTVRLLEYFIHSKPHSGADLLPSCFTSKNLSKTYKAQMFSININIFNES